MGVLSKSCARKNEHLRDSLSAEGVRDLWLASGGGLRLWLSQCTSMWGNQGDGAKLIGKTTRVGDASTCFETG